MANPYTVDLERNPANHMPLTPLSFIERAAAVHPDQLAVVHGTQRFTWGQTYARCRRLASALQQRGIGKNDTVAVMAANTPQLLEAHFGVPMLGAVLNALNTRLDSKTVAFILEHGEAKALITDREFSSIVGPALKQLGKKLLVIDIDDPLGAPGEALGEIDYEAFLAERRSRFRLGLSRRRMGCDLAQLHLGHDRQSQRRRAASPRRLSQRDRQSHGLEHAAAPGLSLDLADVSLQRLVLPLDDRRALRHACVPQARRSRRDLRGHRARER